MTAAAAVVDQHAVVPIRQRIISAAIDLTTGSGWSSVTMGRLGDLVGVSRQTVYNEIHSKPELANAMVLDELGRFLAVVRAAFDQNPDDAVTAIRNATEGVLELARRNALLRAVVSGSSAADVDLLPPLTTRSSSLLDAAIGVVSDSLASYPLSIHAERLATVSELIVRVVLSNVIQPTASPASTASDIAWLAERLLGTAPAE